MGREECCLRVLVEDLWNAPALHSLPPLMKIHHKKEGFGGLCSLQVHHLIVFGWGLDKERREHVSGTLRSFGFQKKLCLKKSGLQVFDFHLTHFCTTAGCFSHSSLLKLPYLLNEREIMVRWKMTESYTSEQ